MITYSKPSQYDTCMCGDEPIIIVGFGYITFVALCSHCFGELGTDTDILETFGVDALLNKEVK